MKKMFVILSVAFALAACDLEIPNQQEVITKNEFNITITRADDTKAVKTGWEEGDVVFVFFSTVAAPDYVKFTYSSGTWSNTKVGTFDITSNGNMTAIYLPYGNSETVSADGTSFKFSNTYTSYYLKAEKAPYTVSGGVVSGTLNMVAPTDFVQFSMPITDGTNTFFRETPLAYVLSEDHLTPFSLASVAADGTISNEAGYVAGAPITGYFYGEGNDRCINFSGILADGAKGVATDYRFTFTNWQGTPSVYDDVIYILTGNKTISDKSAIRFPYISSSNWTVSEPATVTVGGVKWAKYNIGACLPEGSGDYFAWGAVYPQAEYADTDYQEGAIDADLTTAKDVAAQKLGDDWRMPTKAELDILQAKMIPSNWTASNGVNGYLIAPDAGHEAEGDLFIPASGYRDIELIPDFGNYWSSSIDTDPVFVWSIQFDDSFADVCEENRFFGFTVRPVKGAPAPTYPVALSAVTSSYVGSVITSDGYVYATASDASAASKTAVAMIAYVGSDSGEASPYNHGLALALNDANGGNNCAWTTSSGTPVHTYTPSSSSFTSESGLQYNETQNSDTYPAFKYAIANNGTAAPTGCSAWFLASGYQWDLMISSAGGYNILRDGFGVVGGTNMQGVNYWSSTEESGYYAWTYYFFSGSGGGKWVKCSKADGYYVRSVLAF